ncbi:hypothetical protein [Pantoea agglomerans]|uniref:hypothetical protein n=1 Tax=Enterobacter agglomerans TaxID=549 RepID=UPI00177C7C03|nr:hypothetical protein [Pantoea agglomerans]MBD8260488.1 hypothetical protein [Pantoea agglomerans]
MTVEKDNYVDPDKKARWGFAEKDGKIVVGPQTVGETGGVDHARVTPKDDGVHGNGSGVQPTAADIAALEKKNADLQSQLDDANAQLAGNGAVPDSLETLSATELKAKLDELGIEYKGNASQAALLEQLKAAQQPQE